MHKRQKKKKTWWRGGSNSDPLTLHVKHLRAFSKYSLIDLSESTTSFSISLSN